jgi:hypothetical protein
MASPARLIVPANGMQGTRLLHMGARDTERYFRVRFIPVVPEKEDEFAVSSDEREAYKETAVGGRQRDDRVRHGVFRPAEKQSIRQRDR